MTNSFDPTIFDHKGKTKDLAADELFIRKETKFHFMIVVKLF